jgi:hypothetical protein
MRLQMVTKEIQICLQVNVSSNGSELYSAWLHVSNLYQVHEGTVH